MAWLVISQHFWGSKTPGPLRRTWYFISLDQNPLLSKVEFNTMMDMWGELPKTLNTKFIFYDPGSCVFEPSRNPQAAERFQVPPMGLPGWPGAPPFMPMPGENVSPAAVLNVEHHGLFCWRFFRCVLPMPWLKKVLLLWVFFFVWRHAYDATPLGSGFLVKQQQPRCNGWSWVLLYRPFKAMPPWGMPSMPGMTAVPMEHNGFPFDAEVWRSRRSFLYQVVSKSGNLRDFWDYTTWKLTAKGPPLLKWRPKSSQKGTQHHLPVPLIFRGKLAV